MEIVISKRNRPIVHIHFNTFESEYMYNMFSFRRKIVNTAINTDRRQWLKSIDEYHKRHCNNVFENMYPNLRKENGTDLL
jgi:hypothetical protein